MSRHRHDTSGDVDDVKVLDGAHGHGYLLRSRAASPPAAVEGWAVCPLLPGLLLHTHPRTVLSSSTSPRSTVIILGHAVDVDADEVDGERITARLVAALDLGGQDTLVRQAAYLGGRWTLFATSGGRQLLVLPDAHASQAVFTGVRGDRFALGSAPSLPAATLGLVADEGLLALRADLRRHRGRASSFLPGRHTLYRGIDPLLPNHLLHVGLGPLATQEQRRFWPLEERRETTDVDEVYGAFRERFVAHTRLLASIGRPTISLTAGGDSRATAAVAAPFLSGAGGFTFTYINPPDARASASAMADVTGASAVAQQLGLPHRILHWRQPPPGGTFETLYARTFAPLPGSRGAAYAMWADLPGDVVQLQSNCAETGTTFIRDRTDEPLTPLRLLQMAMTRSTAPADLAETVFGGYAAWADFTVDRLLGYDPHDVFYAEQRIGRWGWQKFQDGDLGHRILLPFNDRALVETMLSLPYPLRERKVLFERLWADVPAARLRRPRPLPEEALARLPGPVRRRTERVVRQQRRGTTLARRTFPQGYAVIPHHTPSPPLPAGWVRIPVAGAWLHRAPALRHALLGDSERWTLVLGSPVDVRTGADGARGVARELHQLLSGGQATIAADRVMASAAALAGRYVVVLHAAGRTVVLPDPTGSLGAHPTADGDGLVSHRALTPDEDPSTGEPPHGRALVAHGTDARTWGGLRAVDLGQVVDLTAVVAAASRASGRAGRLARHVEILRRRGPVWLGLSGDASSTELLDLLAPSAPDMHTLTWWDRAAPDQAAHRVFRASELSAAAGVVHRVVGLREDVDGSDEEPGRSARRAAADALHETWPGCGSPPASTAVERTVPRSGVVWLGSVPARDGPATGPRSWDLLQGVRHAALPFSDRLLDLLPPG